MVVEFSEIFSKMGDVCIVFLLIAVILLTIELILPGFGLFGLGGVASFAVAVIIRIANGVTFFQAIVLIIFFLAFLVVMGVLIARSVERNGGKFGNFFGKKQQNDEEQQDDNVEDEEGSSQSAKKTSKNINEEEQESSKSKKFNKNKLVGKEGVIVEDCNPDGKAYIDGVIYPVFNSSNKNLKQGLNVVVEKIEDDNIIIVKK